MPRNMLVGFKSPVYHADPNWNAISLLAPRRLNWADTSKPRTMRATTKVLRRATCDVNVQVCIVRYNARNYGGLP